MEIRKFRKKPPALTTAVGFETKNKIKSDKSERVRKGSAEISKKTAHPFTRRNPAGPRRIK